jgi:hypothetical protein
VLAETLVNRSGLQEAPSSILGVEGSEAQLTTTLANRSRLHGSYCTRKSLKTVAGDAELDTDSLEATTSKKHGEKHKYDPDADPDKTWGAVHGKTCYPTSTLAHCTGNTVAECKRECAANEDCGGFTWPHGHLKKKDCYKHMTPEINTLFLKEEAPKKAATGTVYIIRHGEKQHDGCLSPTGHERAKAVVNMFNGKPSDWHETLDTPKALFAHRYVTHCERTNQTLQPIAEALNLVVNTEHGGNKDSSPGVGGGNTGAAEAIKDALMAGQNPVLVAWESLNMPWLIKDLGTFEFPIYPQGQFDKLYIVELTDGVVTCFHDTWQHWKPGRK